METMKQRKAERILKQKRQREIANQWIEMTNVLAKHKQKQRVLA